MSFPRFAEDADDGHLRRQQLMQLQVVLRGDMRAAGAAKGGQARVLERNPLHALEEGFVLRIGAGPAALDKVHSELIQTAGNANLILDTEANAFALRTVAQGGVVDLDSSLRLWHVQWNVLSSAMG